MATEAGDIIQTQFYKPPYTPYAKSNQLHQGDTEWVKMNNRIDTIPPSVPGTFQGGYWQPVEVEPSPPVRPITPSRAAEYEQRYKQLSQNIAYRYPDPGPPKERQGAIGGPWRHIKEVLGHGGANIYFIDGLVSLYDKQHVLKSGNNRLPSMQEGRRTPLFGANRHDVTAYQNIVQHENEKIQYQSQFRPQGSRFPDVHAHTNRSLDMTDPRYKGFYSMH